jgi:hypothetical protein
VPAPSASCAVGNVGRTAMRLVAIDFKQEPQ